MSEQHKLYGDGIHDDTAALQYLLDHNDGIVTVKNGTYLISNTLHIHDNTRLTLAPGAYIRLADDASCLMLDNDQHGKSGKNRNIIVEGGIWDGNNACQRRGKAHPDKPYNMGVLMRFEDVEDLTVRDLTYKDPEAYACQFRFADRFTVENITFDFNMLRPNMDGIHVNGPSRNGVIRNIKGATNDDLVALNCDDGYSDSDHGLITQGDIENITIENLYAENGFTGVRLLSCGSKLRNVTVRNVFGTYRLYGVSFTHHNAIPGAPIWFDNVTLDGIYCTKQPQDPPVDRRYIDGIDNFYGKGCHEDCIQHADIIWFEPGVQCGNITLANISRNEPTVTQAYTVHVGEGSKIRRLVLNNAAQQFINCPELPLLQNDGEIETLITSNL